MSLELKNLQLSWGKKEKRETFQKRIKGLIYILEDKKEEKKEKNWFPIIITKKIKKIIKN